MIGKKIFEEVSARYERNHRQQPGQRCGKEIWKSMLGSAFNRIDLITREEFDIQQQSADQTRTKLADLKRAAGQTRRRQPARAGGNRCAGCG